MSCSAARISLRPLRTTGWSSAIRIFMMRPPRYGIFACVASAIGDGYLHLRSLAAISRDFDRAAKRQRALADSHQAERFRVVPRRAIDAVAVIFHRQDEAVTVRLHADVDPRRVGVTRDVREQLLEDPECRGRALAIERQALLRQRYVAADPAAPLEIAGLPADPGREPHPVQHLRSQPGGDLEHRLDRFVDLTRHGLRFLTQGLLVLGH